MKGCVGEGVTHPPVRPPMIQQAVKYVSTTTCMSN